MNPTRVLVSIVVVAAVAFAVPGEAAQRELLKTDRFAAPSGKAVVVDVDTLNVFVRAGDVREAEVTTDLRISGVGGQRAEAWIERHTPSFDDGEEKLTVSAQPGRGGFMWIGSLTARARVRLVIPADVIPDITTSRGDINIRGDFPDADPLRLRTATGQIEFDGATASLDVRSASGDARIELVRPLDKLFARTSSGDVTLNGGARQVFVDTASGNVTLSSLSGATEVVTSSGKVTLKWDRLDEGSTVRVLSSAGRIYLILPENVEPRGTLRTTDGTIRCDLPGEINEAGDTVTLQGTGPTLNIETASGDIVIGRRDGWQVSTDAPAR